MKIHLLKIDRISDSTIHLSSRCESCLVDIAISFEEGNEVALVDLGLMKAPNPKPSFYWAYCGPSLCYRHWNLAQCLSSESPLSTSKKCRSCCGSLIFNIGKQDRKTLQQSR